MWAVRRSSPLATLIIVSCTATVWGQTPELKYDFKPGRHYGYDLTVVIDTKDFVETRTGYSLFRVDRVEDDEIHMMHRGELTPHRKEKPGGRRDIGPLHITASPSHMTIDRRGKLLRSQYPESLDYVLGLVETLAIENLPGKPQQEWVLENELKVVESNTFSGISFDAPMGAKRKAKERSEYSIEQGSGDLIRVRKKYTMQSGEGLRGMAHVDVSGGGTFSFHRREGVITELDMQYEILTRKDGDRETVTAKVKCRQMDPLKLKRMVTDLDDEWKRISGILFEELPKTALKPDERVQLLRDLRSSDVAKQEVAVERLLWAPADENPEDIGEALGAIVTSSKWLSAKVKAAKALKTWVSPAAVGALSEAVDDWGYFPGAPAGSDRPLSRSAIEALGAIGTEEAARELCKWSEDYRRETVPALIDAGAAAELPVIELFGDGTSMSRVACQVLTEIGGIRSVLALATEAESGHARVEAAAALETVAKREGMSVDDLIDKASREQPAKAVVGEDSYRTWTDATGAFHVEAQFLSRADGIVKLKARAGKIIDVPIDRLSEVDREFLQKSGVAKVSRPAPQPRGRPRDTELVGGSGGFPFRQVGRNNEPVVGLMCRASSWGGKSAVVLHIPIFDPRRPGMGGVMMAKQGYAIGALKVTGEDLVHSLQITYMRIKPDGRLDPSDSYESEVIGDATGETPVVLGGSGAPVVGIHGRRAAALDAVGLVVLGE